MGYEVKMYIVDGVDVIRPTFVKHNKRWTTLYTNGNAYAEDGNTLLELVGNEPTIERCYSQVVAMVELSKIGDLPPTTEAQYYFYDSDGNTAVIEDSYDDFLGQISVQDMINFIENSEHKGYRRFVTALGVLKTIEGNYRNPVVLLYSH